MFQSSGPRTIFCETFWLYPYHGLDFLICLAFGPSVSGGTKKPRMCKEVSSRYFGPGDIINSTIWSCLQVDFTSESPAEGSFEIAVSDRSNYVNNITKMKIAHPQGLEPRSTILETAILTIELQMCVSKIVVLLLTFLYIQYTINFSRPA